MAFSQILLSVGPVAGATPSPYMAAASDERLIEACLGGDENAQAALIRRYWDEAFRASLLVIGDAWLAEDITQEAFVAALGALEKFDTSRPFGAWLHRITVNKAVDRGRRLAREPELFDPENRPAGAPEPEDIRGAEVLDALSTLDPEDRAILVARYVLDYRATEIGEWLKMPDSTVRVRLHRASSRIRELVGEGDDDGSND